MSCRYHGLLYTKIILLFYQVQEIIEDLSDTYQVILLDLETTDMTKFLQAQNKILSALRVRVHQLFQFLGFFLVKFLICIEYTSK